MDAGLPAKAAPALGVFGLHQVASAGAGVQNTEIAGGGLQFPRHRMSAVRSREPAESPSFGRRGAGQRRSHPPSRGLLIAATFVAVALSGAVAVATAVATPVRRSVTAAAAGIKQFPDDYRVSIVNSPGKDAYPISSFTWLLVPLKSADPAKGKVIKDLLNWIVTAGESEAAGLSYAPLPKNVVQKELKTIYSLQ